MLEHPKALTPLLDEFGVHTIHCPVSRSTACIDQPSTPISTPEAGGTRIRRIHCPVSRCAFTNDTRLSPTLTTPIGANHMNDSSRCVEPTNLTGNASKPSSIPFESKRMLSHHRILSSAAFEPTKSEEDHIPQHSRSTRFERFLRFTFSHVNPRTILRCTGPSVPYIMNE